MLQRPKIEYPCEWEYRIVGTDQEALKKSVCDVVKGREYSLTFSNISRNGKYISLGLTTIVEDEAVRNEIFASLKAQPSVEIVI